VIKQYRLRQLLLALPLAVSSLYASLPAVAQNHTSPSQSTPPTGKPITIVGCLTGYEGRYTIGTMSDTLYLLDGDSASFKRLNARMVQATGTVTESPPHSSRDNVLSQQPPTLTIVKLRKVADGCN
jgi:hypothetical protein